MREKSKKKEKWPSYTISIGIFIAKLSKRQANFAGRPRCGGYVRLRARWDDDFEPGKRWGPTSTDSWARTEVWSSPDSGDTGIFGQRNHGHGNGARKVVSEFQVCETTADLGGGRA